MGEARVPIGASLLLAVMAAMATCFHAGAARADDAGAADVARAREEFLRANEEAARSQWAEALQAFERSAKLRPHAVTTYNIGACQRAMGNYTLARETLVRALAENQAAGGSQLADSLVAEDKAFIAEIDRLVATANVTLEPASASVAVDGRPLTTREGPGVMVAGVREPGPGEPAPSGHFQVLLNPGAHVFAFSRPGFADAIVNRTVGPGATVDLRAQLDRLPATLHIASNEEGAIVTVNDMDVGAAPIDVSRPAGNYHVVVKKPGFKRYEADVSVRPGQDASLRATLAKEEAAPLTKRWWFWTVAGVVVIGAAAGTYALTRSQPGPERPPLNCGGAGWCAPVQ